MLRRLIVLGALALILPASALADTLTLGFSGGTATATTNVSNADDPSTLTDASGSTTVTGDLGTVTFTTGEWNDSTGTFDPGGSITVTANGTGGLPDGTVFDGTFSDSGTWTLTSSDGDGNTFEFNGTVTGTLSPELLAALGMPGGSGTITATIKITFQSGSNVGTVEFGQIVSHTPEPGTLALLGMGLSSIAAMQWRKQQKKNS